MPAGSCGMAIYHQEFKYLDDISGMGMDMLFLMAILWQRTCVDLKKLHSIAFRGGSKG